MGIPLRVLVIEDSEDDYLLLLRELEKGGFDVDPQRVETPEAMGRALRDKPWDIVLSDYHLPRFSGLHALNLFLSMGIDIPFILVSGMIGEELAVEAMKAGAHDYIMKGKLNRLVPAVERELRDLEIAGVAIVVINREGIVTLINRKGCEILDHDREEIIGRNWFDHFLPEDIRERVKKVFGQLMAEEMTPTEYFENPILTRIGEKRLISWRNSLVRDEYGQIRGTLSSGEDITERRKTEEQLRQSEEQTQHTLKNLRKAMSGIIQAMAATVETRDPYTAGHQRRVADLARAMAKEMGLKEEQIDGIRMAGIVHDLGKISVPAEILSKPTKLNDIEFALIKTHPQVSYDILKDIDFPWPVAQTVFQHHERLDGSGYPQGLKGEEMLLEARILAVADVVEAIASHRPYRPAQGIEAALEQISNKKGILYDEAAVVACLKLFREKRFQFD
jgi:PAS domain S-box-containing protein